MKKHTKTIILISLIIILCIIIGVISYFIYSNNNKDIEFTSIDDSFKITLSNKIRPKQVVISKEDYVLDIISAKKQMFMYVTLFNKERDLDFLQLVNNEKTAIASSRENVRDQSEVTLLEFNGLTSYTYSYTYFDKDYNKDLYTEVYWLIDSEKIYIFDFEIIAENTEYGKTLFKNAMNTVKIVK